MTTKKARTVTPKFPESQQEKQNLLEDLARMGCGKLAEVPWGLSSQRMVDELAGEAKAPAELDGIRAKEEEWTEEVVARAYDLKNSGSGLAKSVDFANLAVSTLFDRPGEKANKEGYEVDDILDPRVRNVFIFLIAILYPDHKNRIFKNMAATIGGAYAEVQETNWALLLRETIRKQAGGIGKYNYVSPYLFHLYYAEGQLTDEELILYDEQQMKIQFGAKPESREETPEPESPEIRISEKRKSVAEPTGRGGIAKRTRQSMAT